MNNERSALKIGTDAIVLGSAMTILPSDSSVLDIGTGTGVIALMAAQRCPNAAIEAIDIDADSAAEAAGNFAASPWPSRLCARHTALREYTPSGRFDLIFSNPPYFESSLKNPDGRSATARHTDSLSYREICAFASENLNDEGRLSLILPVESERTLLRLAAGFGLYPFRLLRVQTTPKKQASRLVAEFSKKRQALQEQSLVLMDSDGSRSAEFSNLTKDFYL